MALLKDLLVTGDARVAGTIYGKGAIYLSDAETNSIVPINADTLNGYTAAQIIASAGGSGSGTVSGGRVDYDSETTSAPAATAGTSYRLKTDGGGILFPYTNMASVIGLETELTSIKNSISSGSGSGTVPTNVITFVESTTAPTGKIGVIWYDSSTTKRKVKIWNGSTWEVLNSWQ